MKSLLAGQSFKFWMSASRPIAFRQSALPYILGVALGLATLTVGSMSSLAQGVYLLPDTAFFSFPGDSSIIFGIFIALLGFVGVIFAHGGMNLFDDYFDMKKGAVSRREDLLDGGFRARLGKCSYMKDSGLELADLRRAASLFLAIALLIGLVIFALRGWPVLVFAVITLILGIAYAGPPLRLSYNGFGELVIGFIFGPILVTAASFLMSGQITHLALFASIPMGLLVANIVHVHAVMDYGPDKAAQRKTLPILLGSEKAGGYVSIAFVILAYVSIVIAVVMGALPLAALLVVLTLPLSLVFVRLVLSYVHDEDARDNEFVPQKWMGNYGDWAGYTKAGLGWFMARWLTAQNILMQVALILALTAFTPWYL
ncbi:MAG: prenyltransferase [Coriobacteriia bacterium]|nr:prenyltransferase [Coriobacteriia bacterium]MCL2537550.1 prenyltransferase [Coriobacteriia bacterium]